MVMDFVIIQLVPAPARTNFKDLIVHVRNFQVITMFFCCHNQMKLLLQYYPVLMIAIMQEFVIIQRDIVHVILVDMTQIVQVNS